MSHVATVEIEIKDLDALDQACKRIGLELVRGKTEFKWWGKHVGDLGDYPIPEGFTQADLGKCAHCIRDPDPEMNGAYEIGVVRRRDGRPGFTLMWDFIAGGFGLEKKAGKELNNLRQSYAATVAIKEARRNGFMVSETKLASGQVQLRMSK